MKCFLQQKFREPIDSFIDRLVEGQETKISECEKDLDAKTALKLEFESRHLPAVPLYRFSGDASHWPEFIECLYTHVHCKSSFVDNIKMIYLLNALDGKAKKAIEAVGTCGLFYASAFKTLKREFGNTLLVSHLRLSMFNKPQIKANDRSALQEFHQHIKLNITWLSSLGYITPLYSYDRVTKAILRLQFHLRKEFYKHTKNTSLMDSSWLDRQLKVYFNPLVEVVATQELPNSKKTPINCHINNFLQKQVHKNNKDAKEQNDKGDERGEQIPQRSIKCWLCHENHSLMSCFKFLKKSLEERREFVKRNKLCENCLSKGHLLESCISKFNCRKDGCSQKHRTLLHKDQTVENIATKFKYPTTRPSHLIHICRLSQSLFQTGRSLLEPMCC